MKDYNLQIKIRNNYLLKAMRGAGCQTAIDLSRLTGVSSTAIYGLLNIKTIPYRKNMFGHITGIKECVVQIALALNVLPEDLFPPQHLHIPLLHNVVESELSLPEIQHFLMGNYLDPETEAIENEHKNLLELAVNEALSILTPREEKVLRMRFGIGEKADHTLEEVSQDFTVTQERIRQIEAKALRKLRHPSRRKQLKELLA